MFVFIVMFIKNMGIFSNKSHLITNTIFLYKDIATAYIKIIIYFSINCVHLQKNCDPIWTLIIFYYSKKLRK